ncbi:MAG: hypothetical protein GX307_04675 [Euryarchaeota archaeon]|nr:hypothetical protein [Euryarchaeota archaeon]
MSPAKKKDPVAVIFAASLPLIAERGMDITIEDIASRAKMEPSAVQEIFDGPVDILHEAFHRGQTEMERLYRIPIMGDLEEHMGVLFDGMMLSIKPFGPETYLGIVYRATEDKLLWEIIRRQSGKLSYAVKAFMSEMVTMAIVDQIDQVERVNQNLVTGFIEHLAMVLEGKKIPDIKKEWVKMAMTMFRPSIRTAPDAYI